MEQGRTIFGRYEVTGPLPDIGELERHAARDVHTGVEVEVIRPSALAALRPGARERFRTAWDSTEADRLPAARLRALATGDVDGRPTAVRPSVAAVWLPSIRVAPSALADLAGWLLPAITVAPPPGGVLSLNDVVLDHDGIPRIAPTGIVPRIGLTQPALHEPPEPHESDVDRARYGLGVLLFRSATGIWPVEPTANRSQLRERQRTPTSPADAAPDLPPELAQLLATLMSPDASVRSRAALPPPVQPPTVALPARMPRPPKAHTNRPVASPRAPSLRRDEALAPFAVVLDLDHPAATRGTRQRLAALLDRPADAFEIPQHAPRRVLIDQVPTANDAANRIAALSPAGAPLLVVSTEPPTNAYLAMIAGAVVTLIGGAVGGALAGPLALTSLALLGVAAIAWGWTQSRAAAQVVQQLKLSDQLARRGPTAAPALVDGASKVHLSARAQAARKSVLLADLAAPVRVDLLASIDELIAVPSTADGEVFRAHLEGLDDIRAAALELSTAESAPSPAEASGEDALSRARRSVAAARATRQAH